MRKPQPSPWSTPMTREERERFNSAAPETPEPPEASCPCPDCYHQRLASWETPTTDGGEAA